MHFKKSLPATTARTGPGHNRVRADKLSALTQSQGTQPAYTNEKEIRQPNSFIPEHINLYIFQAASTCLSSTRDQHPQQPQARQGIRLLHHVRELPNSCSTRVVSHSFLLTDSHNNETPTPKRPEDSSCLPTSSCLICCS